MNGHVPISHFHSQLGYGAVHQMTFGFGTNWSFFGHKLVYGLVYSGTGDNTAGGYVLYS